MPHTGAMGFIAVILLAVAIILAGCAATENPLPELNTSGQAAPMDRNLFHMTFMVTPVPPHPGDLPSPAIEVTPGYWKISPSKSTGIAGGP